MENLSITKMYILANSETKLAPMVLADWKLENIWESMKVNLKMGWLQGMDKLFTAKTNIKAFSRNLNFTDMALSILHTTDIGNMVN